MGDVPIKRVVSHGAKVYTDRLDYSQALVTYENGLVASLTASRVTETKIRCAEISAKNSYIAVDYLNRTVEVSRKTNFSLDVGYPVQYKQENIVEKVIVPISEPLRAEFVHFAECIKTGAPVATSGEMGKRALELCEEIEKSALGGLKNGTEIPILSMSPRLLMKERLLVGAQKYGISRIFNQERR